MFGGEKLPANSVSPDLRPVPGTNWTPRMSTGIELQTMLPVVNAPFRIYYAYNALRLDGSANPPLSITRAQHVSVRDEFQAPRPIPIT